MTTETNEQMGHCRHGAFNLFLGCPQCIAEQQIELEPTWVVESKPTAVNTASGPDTTRGNS